MIKINEIDVSTPVTETGKSAAVGATPLIALPESFPVETATLGRQPNNDGDNSGAMWFE
ncbi:hypothetical protein OG775_10675 [Streptomyces platensis]|uniref:hypothetical protein n=1 Tax=Streptomyces platensis TaxID=58346 RepID=UPI002252DD1F|nr:hypothetical protein [Streptomyces platensis]MCX4635599.1 hypothetical protein [Streptomyces platensis]